MQVATGGSLQSPRKAPERAQGSGGGSVLRGHEFAAVCSLVRERQPLLVTPVKNLRG